MKEQQPPAERQPEPARARHGYRNEVNWEGGSARHDMPTGSPSRLTGRQPYANQGPVETPSPAASAEYPAGNRAERSGRNLEQLEQARRKP
ncbi:hypothetical protein [Ramlibacter sp.]|uniref:hypothetical protein n=1 Tax=Ramlibacter sp. TaxID=1917967 RepID=UPI002D636AAC|nr:hypothetical protein [Ramlibacter sp.]HYD77809.1 hypothetical protein [Ramlibacter sp.]